ncbi:integrase [Streptomyces sp. NEAU-W12]|uniref:integrase n=1 Tax=Streptomyces sp. NEAU-W12 TaxID=2994668 RepID=UPI00224B8291|nr:integrase [Streptomyces sp. NEAU-W12]MCX2925253.1 integrase [Streptomyces sp. NEAU-W12]
MGRRDAHAAIPAVWWSTFPASLRQHFRAFFLAALDHPVPVEPNGRQSPGEQASIGTFPYWIIDMRVIARWLADQHFENLSDVRNGDLDAFRTYVLDLDRTDGRKADLIGAVRVLWLFHDHLPDEGRLGGDFPWHGRTANEVVGAVVRKRRENKTPRISDATVEALLASALVMIEEIGPDIRDAWREYQQLEAGKHSSQTKYTGTTQQRFLAYIEHCTENGLTLPGQVGEHGLELAGNHVLRLVGVRKDLRSGLTPGHRRLFALSGLPLSPVAGIGKITGRVNGRPWRPTPIDVSELPTMVRLLSGALFTAICYLSGMRPGEVLNLRRGCRSHDAETGELQVNGHRGKGFDRAPDSPDVTEPSRPWVVVDAVHAAIALAESLHDLPLLFPSSLASAHHERPSSANARKGTAMNDDIQDLISWINSEFRRADGADAIPADPAGRINATRFRRTLARFIVRRPRGLIAAALQYGHVDTKVTLSYAGNEDPSWLQDVAVERLELIIDQIEEDTRRLEAGEHVSGPSAQDYRDRVTQSAPFAGRVVTGVRNAERLLEQADPAVHHGQGMTCVWRAATAACRTAKLALGLPGADAPDETDCRSTCANLAYTDRDITELQQELVELQADAVDLLAPQPRRDRAAAQAAQHLTIIERHHASATEDERGMV